MENKEIESILKLRDLLFPYDSKGSLMDNGENYLYKTYFDSTKACSIVFVSKEITPNDVHSIKFPYNLNEYDTKVSPGLQNRVIETVIRDFIHKERMKTIENEIKQAKEDLALIRSCHSKNQLNKNNIFLWIFKRLKSLAPVLGI